MTPKGSQRRGLVRWTFYAPSRADTFARAVWPDIDLARGKWEVVGKGDKVDVFDLAPPLVRELRLYRKCSSGRQSGERRC